MLKIGMLIPEFPSQTHAFFWREVQALRQSGVTVELLSTRRPDPSLCQHRFAEEAIAQTHYLFPPRYATFARCALSRPIGTASAVGYAMSLKESKLSDRLRKSAIALLAADLVDFCRKAGLQHVHCHSCADAAHIVAMARQLGGPTYSLTLHGDLPVYGKDHASKMSGAAFVAAVTAPLKRQILEQVGLPASRVPVLWMGVDSDHFADTGQRSYTPGRLHMVTVARLNLMKGHRHALSAMKQAVDQGLDLRYTIAGDGPNRSDIEAQVRQLNLADRVEMAGTLSESAVLDLLQRADAFVLPSVGLGEAAPVSVMEAMSCGLPVICSIIGGTPDMISDDVDGLLVKQADVDALRDAMIRLASHAEDRRRLGLAARQRAVDAFDCRSTARRLLLEIQKHVASAPSFTEEHVTARQPVTTPADR